MKTNREIRSLLKSASITLLFCSSSNLYAVTNWKVRFLDSLPSTPVIRAQKVRVALPPFSINPFKSRTLVNDTASARWYLPKAGCDPTSSTLRAVSSYLKFDNYGSVQWRETSYSPNSPLLMDLHRNGFQFSKPNTGVYFDLNGNGDLQHIQWVAENTDDAFLAQDLNRNGIIDDGSELFGVGTLLELKNKQALNGFSALEQYDNIELGGNEDQLISSEDDVWNRLVLWTDRNADGISTKNEIIKLKKEHIINIDIKDIKETDIAEPSGNFIPLWSWATLKVNKGPDKMKIVDVFFKNINVVTLEKNSKKDTGIQCN